MKCPKCEYLGYEAGDRCRHCGYDFSLIPAPSIEDGPPMDLDLNVERADAPRVSGWEEDVDRALGQSGAEPEAPVTTPKATVLPLFAPARREEEDDEPLIRFPSAPRSPLSVRRTPEAPRARPSGRPVRRVAPSAEPVLEFGDAGEAPKEVEVTRQLRTLVTAPGRYNASGPGRRLTAAVIDLVLLLGIDVAVVYFTLRMAALATADWALLPPAPLFAFLMLVKLAYFFAFTAVGGQTIGKMAVGIRVVADDGGWLDGSRALRRTVVGAFSALIGGLGFLPALVGEDRRALHDRVARTRVVTLRSV